jgi:hypothetical protein
MKVDRQAFGEHGAGARPTHAQHRPAAALIGDRGEPSQTFAEFARKRVAGKRVRHGKPLPGPVADKAHRRPVHGARAIGKLDPVGRRDRPFQRFRLALPRGDGGKTEPGSLFDRNAGLTPFPAEAAANGEVHKCGGRVEGAARHGGALLPDR